MRKYKIEISKENIEEESGFTAVITDRYYVNLKKFNIIKRILKDLK